MSSPVTLLITHLPRSTLPETLLYLFPSQGLLDIRNNSDGTGSATYADLEDAERAVGKMDGGLVDGHRIGVQIVKE